MRGLAFPLTPQVPEAILSPATTHDDIPIDPALHSPIVQVRFDYDLALVCADRLGPRFHTHSPIWSTHFSSNPLQVNGFTTDSHKEILLRPRTPFHCCRPSWPSNLHLHLHPRDQERNGADAAIVKAPMPRTNWVNQSLWRLVTSVDEAVHVPFLARLPKPIIITRPSELHAAVQDWRHDSFLPVEMSRMQKL